jgi:hypothetical protein
MAVILLDSNAVIYLSKGLITINELPNDRSYAVSIITYMEVMGYDFNNAQEKSLIESLFGHFTVLMLDQPIANRVVNLRQIHKIKLPDAIICATAIQYQATLVTNDIRLGKIDGLSTYQLRKF